MGTCRFVEDPQYVRKYDIRIAMVLGEKAATFIQQVHYHAFWKSEKYGTSEWRSSLSEWEETFPHWSRITIRRVITDCRDSGILKVRKEINARGTAHWFSLDYEVLEKIGTEGERLLKEGGAQKEQGGSAQIEHVDKSGTSDQNEQDTVLNLTAHHAQNEQHLVYPSSRSDSTTINRSTPANAGDANSSEPTEEAQRTTRLKHYTKARAHFEKSASPASVDLFWKAVVAERYGKHIIPLTTVDRRNIKKYLVPFCADANVDLLKFIEWCVNNWKTLKEQQFDWASNFGSYPSMKAIFALRTQLLAAYYESPGTQESAITHRKVKKIYRHMDQVAKDHPHRAEIEALIRTMGKAEVTE